jgi:hypothetical protein
VHLSTAIEKDASQDSLEVSVFETVLLFKEFLNDKHLLHAAIGYKAASSAEA